MKHSRLRIFSRFAVVFILCFCVGSLGRADSERDRIQQELNAAVMSKPFNVPSEATLNEALKSATDRGRPSKTSPATIGYIGYSSPGYLGYYRPSYYSAYYGPLYWRRPFLRYYRPYYLRW